MSEAMEYVEYLSREIGPRPAGTEEEQQAALYITERLQNDTEFPATIEDFTGSSNLGGLRMLCSLVAVVVTLLAMFFPVVGIPAFVLATAAAAIYALEAYGNRPITRAFSRGASQNVVAKYQPEATLDARRRKVVLVAHYDSGKVTPALVERVEALGLPFGAICTVALCLNALLLLIRVFAFSGSGGMGLIIFNIITIVVLLVVAIPGVRGILYRLAPYNEGANNNATGVAAIMEIARRISFGSVSEADLATYSTDVTIHGEGEARKQDLIPEGAQLVYEASQILPPDVEPSTPEDRLYAAKAALAAFTGQPIPRRPTTDVANKLVGSRVTVDAYAPTPSVEMPAYEEETPAQAIEEPAIAEAVEEAAEVVETVEAIEAAEVVEEAVAEAAEEIVEQVEEESETTFENVPSWFAAAQRKAKRTVSDTGTIQRSVYAEAMDAAEREREARREEQRRIEEAAAAEAASKALQARLAEEAERGWVIEKKEEPEPEEAAEQEILDGEAVEQPAEEVLDVQLAEGEAAEEVDLGATIAFNPLEQGIEDDDVHRRPIVLPNFEAERGQEVRPIEATKQRAPLAEAATDGKQAARTMLTMLPSVDSNEPEEAPASSPSRSGMIRRLRTDIPSLSGVIREQNGETGEAILSTVSTVGSFGAAGTGSFAPVGEELFEDADPEDIYVDDADDSSIEENYTETGAYAGPDYVEMPKSRLGRFFDRFRKHEETLEETPQEWLDVDEEFDPRTVGRERGGWESFRQDEEFVDDLQEQVDEVASAVADAYDDYADFDAYEDYEETAPETSRRGSRRWQGGAFSRVRLGHVDMRSGEGADDPVVTDVQLEDADVTGEIESIYHFRNPDFNTEIWFVALGSEVDFHDGIEAFMNAHRSELRGAMVIDVEAIGAGELSIIQEEGLYKRIKTSSRIKRYIQKANRATGRSLGLVSLRNIDSSASVALKGGMQAVHLAGIENGIQALRGNKDDVIENVDEETFERNIDYLMELVRHF